MFIMGSSTRPEALYLLNNIGWCCSNLFLANLVMKQKETCLPVVSVAPALLCACIIRSYDHKIGMSNLLRPVYRHYSDLFNTKQLMKNTNITEILLKRPDLSRRPQPIISNCFSLSRKTTAVDFGHVVCFSLLVLLAVC